MSSVTIDLYVTTDGYIGEVDSPEHLEELERENVEVESFTVHAPMKTIYYQSGQADGYITTYFYISKELMELHKDIVSDEYMGGTDSEGDFEVAFFSEYALTDIDYLIGEADEYSDEMYHYLSTNCPDKLDQWLDLHNLEIK